MPHAFPRWFPRQPALRRSARRALRRIIAWALRRRSAPYPIENDRTVLVVAPHQDDGSLGCGGMILLKRLEGGAVRVVYLTDGAASHPGHPFLRPAELARLRRSEAQVATAILGVDQAQLVFLALPDGTLDKLNGSDRRAAVERIAAALLVFPPEEVFLPYRRDGSSEHEGGFLLVREALAAAELSPRLFEYPVWAWWSPLRLLRPLLFARRVWRVDHSGYETAKAAAVAAYASQTQPTPPWTEPVLSAEFVAAFTPAIEYFFEIDPL